MIRSIRFENFRGLKLLEFPELSQITLLTGRNNAGKSSILEGIFLFMDHSAPDSFGKINSFRGLYTTANVSNLWELAFYGLNTANPLRIAINLDGEECNLQYIQDDSYLPPGEASSMPNSYRQFVTAARSTYTLKYLFSRGNYTENGIFSVNENGIMKNIATNKENNALSFLPETRFIGAVSSFFSNEVEIADWLGQIELKGKKQQIVDVLKYLEPEVSDILTIANQGQIKIYIRVSDQLFPVRLAGDGMNRLLHLILVILAHPDSIVLIDEIDTGFHYSMLGNLWTLIASAARESNCQIIASTHSYECVQSAVDGMTAADMMDHFCLYRLEHRDNENRAFRMDAELVRYSTDANMEVR